MERQYIYAGQASCVAFHQDLAFGIDLMHVLTLSTSLKMFVQKRVIKT